MAPGRKSVSRLSLPPPLPSIIEDPVDIPPAIPPKSPRRLTVPPKSLGSTPQSSELSVPDRTSEALEKGLHLRDREWIAKRGGWYRLVLGVVLIIAIIIGLAVGLTLGLQNRNPPPVTLPTAIFPSGSYAFTTALTSTSALCTTNPSTWRCFPYSTFSPSAPSLSEATFYWIIQPLTSYSYAISSSDNPFAPQFRNIPLTLLDPNQHSERFTFNFTLDFVVTPNMPLPDTASSGATRCTFYNTVMSATIWTKMRGEYPAGIERWEVPVNRTRVFAGWPFRVEKRGTREGDTYKVSCRSVESRSRSTDVSQDTELRISVTAMSFGTTFQMHTHAVSMGNSPILVNEARPMEKLGA
ncbi:hypothetical protein QBC34DRAFT_423652 [Podospora aff. communis PSN243]|uniref:Tat pathway signal sequence n=1 Tax=Podospora aff. communis PSN243 TaxID=3040156 RepID=A0AAV9GTK4_9PEZI|nr:hypothetical protein QBC34DRAFT_423652 [Podospora aff. communis PSN243]